MGGSSATSELQQRTERARDAGSLRKKSRSGAPPYPSQAVDFPLRQPNLLFALGAYEYDPKGLATVLGSSESPYVSIPAGH